MSTPVTGKLPDLLGAGRLLDARSAQCDQRLCVTNPSENATVTLAKRAVRGEPIWKAHREHYYQRLILAGWSHRRAAVAEYILMAVCAAAGMFVVFSDIATQTVVCIALMLMLMILMAMVDRYWRLQQRPEGT